MSNVKTIILNQPRNSKLGFYLRCTSNCYSPDRINNIVKLETDQSEIFLNSSSTITHFTNTIIVPDCVKSFAIQDLTIYPYSKVFVKYESEEKESSIPVEVRNLTIEQNGDYYYTLQNVTINGILNLKQKSKVMLDESVSLTDADIIYKIDVLNSNNLNPVLQSLKPSTVPKSFTIELPEDRFNVSQVQDVVLNKGLFDCDAWASKVSFSSQYFSKANCTYEYNEDKSRFLADDDTKISVLTLLKNEEYHNYDADPKVVEKKKNLSGGAIAGIVIGCVVAVAALMIGEFFLVKHLLNKDNAPSEKEAEEV